jgi:hypothetical protein
MTWALDTYMSFSVSEEPINMIWTATMVYAPINLIIIDDCRLPRTLQPAVQF